MESNACDILPTLPLTPCTIIIFGASGDLTQRKLIPALLTLFQQKRLPENFSIVGCSRTTLSNDDYRVLLLKRYTEEGRDLSGWDVFAKQLFYFPLEYNQRQFQALAQYLQHLDHSNNTQGNRIFDLAVPPNLYPVIAKLLGESGLSRQYTENLGWSRIVVEKPFGRDLETALALEQTLHRYFDEQQIFRIDHYLAKETVQNMLIFRFANAIFEPIWNRSYIDYIGITAAESLGVGTRAGYYENSGVVRDMFQNHLMQLLVLTAMEPPARLTAEEVQDEKVKVIRALRDFTIENGSRITLGQYHQGQVDGQAVKGYRHEDGVDTTSNIPTFALLETYVDNWRWQGVPFYLVSGKRMPQKETRITIQFKEVPHKLFANGLGSTARANRLSIDVYPQESIRLSFQTKNPGSQLCLRTMEMDFAYKDHYQQVSLDAYARVLLDCISGDHMLFWRQDGIQASWTYLTPILEACDHCQGDRQLHPYPAGSFGPEAVAKRVQGLLQDT